MVAREFTQTQGHRGPQAAPRVTQQGRPQGHLSDPTAHRPRPRPAADSTMVQFRTLGISSQLGQGRP